MTLAKQTPSDDLPVQAGGSTCHVATNKNKQIINKQNGKQRESRITAQKKRNPRVVGLISRSVGLSTVMPPSIKLVLRSIYT